MDKRIVFFFDGFNLWHALDHNPALRNKNQYHKYKWLNLHRLAQCFVPEKEIAGLYYFTALAVWDPNKVARHKTYISALRSVGAKIIFGNFKLRDKKCHLCQGIYKAYEEKHTDVNIAITLFQSALKDEYDTAIIVSGDSDLVPAIEAVKMTFPGKQMGVMIPIGRRAELLKQVTDFKMKIKESHLAISQFPDEINLGEGTMLKRPESWK